MTASWKSRRGTASRSSGKRQRQPQPTDDARHPGFTCGLPRRRVKKYWPPMNADLAFFLKKSEVIELNEIHKYFELRIESPSSECCTLPDLRLGSSNFGQSGLSRTRPEKRARDVSVLGRAHRRAVRISRARLGTGSCGTPAEGEDPGRCGV